MEKLIFSDAQSVDVAYVATVLANNPDLQRFFEYVRQLRHEYGSGQLCVPAVIDLTGYDPDTAAAAAALVMAVKGVG